MRVGYFSPVPPERSGIADYSAELLPALRERFEVVVPRRGAKRLPRSADIAIYHIGNEPDVHSWIVEAMRRQPGIVVLHDFVLHHLIAGMTLGRGDGPAYLAAMQREAGVAGRLLAHGVIDGVVPPLWESCPQDYPLVKEILPFATALIVHSEFVADAVRARGYRGQIYVVPHYASVVPAQLPDPDLPVGVGLIVGCFGNINPAKRIPQVLEAFAAFTQTHPDALLVIAGDQAPELRLDQWIDELGLGGNVVHRDYVDEPMLWALLRASDVCVSLRWPTMGETSGIVLRALSAGRPVIVSDVGAFQELPDEVVAKVPVDEYEVPTLTAMLTAIADDAALRAAMGTAAARLVETENTVEVVAERYAIAIEDTAGRDLVQMSVFEEVARSAGDVGIDSTDSQIAELARRLKELGI